MPNTKIYFLMEEGMEDISNFVLSGIDAKCIEISRKKENRHETVPEYGVYTLVDPGRVTGRNSLQFAFIPKPGIEDDELPSEHIQGHVLALSEELRIRKPDYVISLSSYMTESPKILVPNSTFWNMLKEGTNFYFPGIAQMNLFGNLDHDLWRNLSSAFFENEFAEKRLPTLLLPWPYRQNEKSYEEFFRTYSTLGTILHDTQYETQLMLRCQKLRDEYFPLAGKLRFGKILAGYDQITKPEILSSIGQSMPEIINGIKKHKKNEDKEKATRLTL